MKLFRPAWDSKYVDVAVEAVNKLTDKAELARVAKEARCFEARNEAVKKLTGHNMLVDFVKNASDCVVRKNAVTKLTDQNALTDIAKNDINMEVRITAALMLANHNIDEDLLMELIGMCGNELKNSYSEKIRSLAAEALISFYRKYRKKEIIDYNGTIIHYGRSDGHADHPCYDDYSHEDIHIKGSCDSIFNTEDA